MKGACEYQLWRHTPDEIVARQCRNRGRWKVTYLTPDDGKSMRRRIEVVRCTIHTHERFFPHGASQIMTRELADPPKVDGAQLGRMVAEAIDTTRGRYADDDNLA